MLFESALQDYEKQTGVALTNHPLAKQLRNCGRSVESVTAVLREQAQDFCEFPGKDKAMKSLQNIVSVLSRVQDIGPVRPDSEGADWVFSVPDPHPTAFPTYNNNIHRPRYLSFCMCLYLAHKSASS
jgi:hypothetical protein